MLQLKVLLFWFFLIIISKQLFSLKMWKYVQQRDPAVPHQSNVFQIL